MMIPLNMSKNNRFHSVFILCVLLITTASVGNTQDKFLKINGKVLKRYDQKKLKQPVIISSISSCGDTNKIKVSNGKYKLYLSPGCEYEVHYNSQDYVDKFFKVDVLNVPKNVREKHFSLPVDIMMVRKVDGLDTAIFEYAQGKAFYHKVLKTFVWDPDYTSKAIIRADSVLVNIGAQDTIETTVQKPIEKPEIHPFEPLYLFILQKDVPTKEIVQKLGKPTLKTGPLQQVQSGILWAQMNLFFILKDDEKLLAFCAYYTEEKCDKNQAIAALDKKPIAFQDPLFKSGVLLEKLYWLSQKQIFKYPDYLATIKALRKTLEKFDATQETDAVLSYKSDLQKIIQLFEVIEIHNLQDKADYQNKVQEFAQIISQTRNNF